MFITDTSKINYLLSTVFVLEDFNSVRTVSNTVRSLSAQYHFKSYARHRRTCIERYTAKGKALPRPPPSPYFPTSFSRSNYSQRKARQYRQKPFMQELSYFAMATLQMLACRPQQRRHHNPIPIYPSISCELSRQMEGGIGFWWCVIVLLLVVSGVRPCTHYPQAIHLPREELLSETRLHILVGRLRWYQTQKMRFSIIACLLPFKSTWARQM